MTKHGACRKTHKPRADLDFGFVLLHKGVHLVLSTSVLEEIPQLLLLPPPAPRIVEVYGLFGEKQSLLRP